MSDVVAKLVSMIEPLILKESYRRIRFAISPQEHEALKQYIMENYDGVFYNRILNIPLIIESDPENPILTRQEI
jgi:hypothetical protein